ncbi:helix-turn-helix domain-containing protein [uncultured Bacteroides sp.]|uniref:helix-turn-helix domain-containing protein n=1 Tax=uncultured Bacteroides sp. TaxID=162156 RepID=UPI002AAA8995|nr:helix-turn-helix domain-containing protein [uncultured Bacteroides sp.]
MDTEIKDQLDRIERLTLLSAKNVLCFNDVALLTGLSKSHLYKLTCSHQIPHYKPNGKQIYFDRVELESWMKQNRIQTTDETESVALNYMVTGKINGRA